MAFLYGLDIPKIQDFIFSTNALKEIIGASEIVKGINPSFIKSLGFQQCEIILANAGHLRIKFDNESDVRKILLVLPKILAKKHLQGIYAVVNFSNYKDSIKELENALKIQKNKPTFPLDLSLAIMKYNPKTALPRIDDENDNSNKEQLCHQTFTKLESYDNFVKNKPHYIKELKELKNDKNKIAIIYADGNALGKIVSQFSKENEMSEFSNNLDSAIKRAFNNAKSKLNTENKLREVICGGDDLIVICNADIALRFSEAFLDEFEKQTQNIYHHQCLTSCVGIAFCNHKYPIAYALNLAKNLCSRAKLDSKKINPKNPPSSLMFHNIQSSANMNFDDILENELIFKASGGKSDIHCDFGAYFLKKEYGVTIKALCDLVDIFRDKDSPSSRLRNWLSLLECDKNLADNELKRIAKIYEAFAKKHNAKFQALHKDLSLQNARLIIGDSKKDSGDSKDFQSDSSDSKAKTPIFDIISIHSITKGIK